MVTLSWGPHGPGACLHIAGLYGGARVRVVPSSLLDAAFSLPGMAGELWPAHGVACFAPRFPFIDGVEYAVLRADGPRQQLLGTIERPSRIAAPSTSVAAVFPAVEEIPLNLLKVYVLFSAPMSEGFAASAVSVWREGDTEPLPGVFLNGPELWDRARTRLTLLLDPGRIKRGLVPQLEAGYPLVAGTTIELRIGEAFLDARGGPLVAPCSRRYAVGPAERSRIEPAKWHIAAPAAATRQPLAITFGRALDHALLARCLSVRDAAGARVPGIAEPAPDDTGWTFTPGADWRPGDYVLAVESRLEDLAGNSVARVFDRDLDRPADFADVEPLVTVAFACEQSR